MDNENITTASNITSTHSSKSLVSLIPPWIITSVVIFIVLAIFIGILGNTLVIAVLLKNKLKTSTDWFIIFIAFCDVISLAVNGPIDIFRYQSNLWYRIGSPGLCKFHYYVVHILYIESSFLLLFVSVDRFLKTCRPHGRYFTPTISFWFCIAVSLGSMLCAIPNLFTSTASRRGTCRFDQNYKTLRSVYAMTLTIATVLCTIILVLIYSKIALVLKKREQAKRERREMLRHALQTGDYGGLSFDGRRHTQSSKPACETKSLQIEDIDSNHEMQVFVTSPKPGTSAIETDAHISHGKGHIRFLQSLRNYAGEKKNKVHPTDLSPVAAINPSRERSQRTNSTVITSFNSGISADYDQSKRARKTTKMIFAVVLIYIVSTMIPAVIAPFLTETTLRNYPAGQALIFLTLRLYTINNFANPLLYMCLSSNFRKKSLAVIRSFKIR